MEKCMLRFLLLYLSIYPLVHYYAFRKIRAAFLPGRKAKTGMALFMAAMIAAPLVVRLAERAGIATGARFWAYVSFSWMGLLFLFFSLAAVVDLGRLAFLAAEKCNQRLAGLRISLRRLLAMQTILVSGVYGYGVFEAADIRLEHIEIPSPKITEQTGRIRIAQISDVHLGLIIREGRLNRILRSGRRSPASWSPPAICSTASHLNKEAGCWPHSIRP
jgi:hypothetical protein